MSDETNTPEAPKGKTMQEMINSIDITQVTPEQIISEIMASIQHLATSAAIGYGILARLKVAEIAAKAGEPEVVTPELEVV